MDEDTYNLAEPMIRRHEGSRSTPYVDTRGKLTIGIGRNLTDKGLEDDEIEYLFHNDLQEAVDACNCYPYWFALDDARRAALVDMAFQMGAGGLRGFHKMHAAIQEENWPEAYAECLDSDYAEQTSERALENANILLSGAILYDQKEG